LTSRLASKSNRGLALGVYNATAGMGWIIAGIGSGHIAARFGYAVTFGISGGLLVLSLAILLSVPDPGIESKEKRVVHETPHTERTASSRS